jgi:small subunit ribosomal protein S21
MAAAGVSTAAGYGRMAHGAQARTMDFAQAFCYTRPTRRPGFPGFSAETIAQSDRLFTKERCVQVLVRDNNVDQALKALKKKMQREGIFREMKLRGHYEKPSEKKARQKAEAVRRARKLARKRAQREGLLPSKPKPVFGAAPGAAAGGRGGPGRGGPGRGAPRF